MNDCSNSSAAFSSLLQMDLKRAFLNWRFLFAVIVMWLIMLLSILSIVLSDGKNLSWDYYFQYAEHSDYQIIFYMCAVFPYTCSFLEDYREGYGVFILSRGLKEKYALSKCLAVILSACGVIATAFFTFFAVVRIIFPTSADTSISSYIIGIYTPWLDIGGGFIYVASRSVLIGFASATFALIALTVSIYLHDVLIINALPLIAIYAVSNLGSLLKLPDKFNLFILANYSPGIGTAVIDYLYSIGVFLLIIILISKLFIKLVEERTWA